MWEQLSLAVKDIYESYATIRAVDVAQPSFIALWMVILFTPLIGIDRRDKYCSMMYVAYLAGAGVALIFALPRQYIEQSSTLSGQLAGTVMMMIAAAVRWYYGARQVSGRSKQPNDVQRLSEPVTDDRRSKSA
jgi:hypothetical protein